MFAARILCAILLATTITGQSDFSTSSSTWESSEPMFQKTEIASVTYKNRLLRVWASSSNRYDIPTSQWQFRYDPLLIPMTDDQGQLVVTTEQFGDSWRTSFDLVLDDESTRSLAFDSVRQAYKNIEGLRPSNMFAIPMKSIAIRIPDLTGFHPEVYLLGHQPCPPETACYPFDGPVSSVRVTVSSPTRTAADEIESLIPKCQIYFEITSPHSPVTVTFQALRDSYFYTELRDKHSADYVSKFELRRILQISRQTLRKDLTVEKSEGFDSGMLEQLWKRWTIMSSEDFKPGMWTQTYNADQSSVDGISDALNDMFIFDRQDEKFKVNFNSVKNHDLFLLSCDGYANKKLTESELKRCLEDNGIHIDFYSNKIIVRTLDFVKIDWSELTDPNTLSQPLFTYLPFQVEKESGFIDFSSFRARRSTSSVPRTTALELLQNQVKQLLEDNKDFKNRLSSNDDYVYGILTRLQDIENGFKEINTTMISNQDSLERIYESVNFTKATHPFENKINKVPVLTRNLSTSVEDSNDLKERLSRNEDNVFGIFKRLENLETSFKNIRNVMDANQNLLDILKVSANITRRMHAFEKTINEVSVSTRNRLTSVEKLSMSTETRLEKLSLTVPSELRDRKSVSIQLFETVSKELAENWLCKPEWKLFCNCEKCNCYFLEKAAFGWDKALDNCRRLGGDLASIHSDEESEFIAKLFNVSRDAVWIGLNDATKEGIFEWTDGSPVDFTNWSPSNSAGEDEDWVYIWKGKWWGRDHITGEGGYISVCKEQINIEQIHSSESFMKELSIKLTNRQIQNLGKAVEHSVCDPGWKLHCDSISCNCYFYDLEGRSWSDALFNCQSLGSDLISIHSYDEMIFVKELVGVTGTFGVWIGLSKRGCEGKFAWSDGTPVDFLYWDASEPNDKCNEHCGDLSRDRTWYDANCEEPFESICKMKIPKTM